MRRKHYCFVFSSALHIDLDLLIYASILLTTYLIVQNPHMYFLWFVLLSLLIGLMRFSWIIGIDKDGLSLHRLFQKKLFLSWEKVLYCGTTTKTIIAKKKITYQYFSTQPLVCAPWEKMPPMTEALIYFTTQQNIRNILLQVNQKHLASHFTSTTPSPTSDNMRRKIIGSTILLFGLLTVASIYFIITQPYMILVVVFPLVHFSLLMLSIVNLTGG